MNNIPMFRLINWGFLYGGDGVEIDFDILGYVSLLIAIIAAVVRNERRLTRLEILIKTMCLTCQGVEEIPKKKKDLDRTYRRRQTDLFNFLSSPD